MSTISKTKANVYKLTGMAILSAIIIVLQIFSTFVKFGPFSITLALIPIVVGAAMYGMGAGAFLGAVMGVVVTIMSATGGDVGGFMVWSANPFLCAVLCILKTAAAGFVAGLLYRSVSKIKHRNMKMEAITWNGEETLIHKRNVGLSIFLSVITFGLYAIYWQYLLVKNYRALKRDTSGCIGEMLCLIFVPYYASYWFYTRGETLKKEFGDNASFATGNGAVYLLLSVFGMNVVAMAIMQHDYNALDSKIVEVERDNKLAAAVAAAVVTPFVNTGIFIIGMELFFRETLKVWAGGSDILTFIIIGLTGINFLIELSVNVVLSPVVVKIVDAVKKTNRAI